MTLEHMHIVASYVSLDSAVYFESIPKKVFGQREMLFLIPFIFGICLLAQSFRCAEIFLNLCRPLLEKRQWWVQGNVLGLCFILSSVKARILT